MKRLVAPFAALTCLSVACHKRTFEPPPQLSGAQATSSPAPQQGEIVNGRGATSATAQTSAPSRESAGGTLPTAPQNGMSLASSPCTNAAATALKSKYPQISLDDIYNEISFDCKESSLIISLDQEMSTSTKLFQALNGFADKLPVPLVQRSFEILKPYCRTDNEIYGSFCMAADVSSALMVSQNSTMLKALPAAVHAIAAALAVQPKVNFVEIVAKLPEFANKKKDAILLAAFLGLDDNGVQTTRLKANLIFSKQWDVYAEIFPWISQYIRFPKLHDLDPSDDFSRLLYATRSGTATIPHLHSNAQQTYKTYAGVYLGCRNAQNKLARQISAKEAQDIGYLYQIIKLRQSVGKPWQEFLKDRTKYDEAGKQTASLMRTGAEYGYEQCEAAAGG